MLDMGRGFPEAGARLVSSVGSGLPEDEEEVHEIKMLLSTIQMIKLMQTISSEEFDSKIKMG